MSDDSQPPPSATATATASEPASEPATETVTHLSEPETATEAEAENHPTPEPTEPEKRKPEPAASEEPAIVESEEKPPVEQPKKTFIQPAVSFKEESNLLIDLTDFQKKSLDELKNLLAGSLSSSGGATVDSDLGGGSVGGGVEEEEVSIWGVPLLKDERSDVILLKFLRARDFKAGEAAAMLKNTLKWRKDFGIDKLMEEDLGDDLEKVVFMHGHDTEGHPVCYNVYGEFQNKELYTKTFSSEAKRGLFLRWRIRFLERSIRELDFGPGGVNTIFQVNDLKNAPGPAKRELRQATREALLLLQDNYPEFVAKQVFINVPWWYVAFYTMMSPFMTQRTKSKFVFAGPSKTADTLFKYISPEQVPIQYGGLSVDYCDCNPEFTVDDPATVINVKPSTKQSVVITCFEKCVITWELRVVGWEVTYSAEFVPDTTAAYTVIIQKATKMASNDDPVISGSFKVSDLGKVILKVDNPTFKKRKLLYRYKVLPYSD